MAGEDSAVMIARRLAASVHAGRFRPNEMFPSERDLCEEFGVGRNVIREATTLLHSMGLVDQVKGKRPRVVAPALSNMMRGVAEAAQMFFAGNEGLAHLEQARLFLETSMLRYAVEHATNAQVAKLVEAVETCEAHLDDNEGFRDADERFHRALAEIPGNPIFTALHDTFVKRMMTNRSPRPDIGKGNRDSNAEHRQIVSAMLDKDAETAVEVLTRHLARNYAAYFRLSLEQTSEAGSRFNTTPTREKVHE